MPDTILLPVTDTETDAPPAASTSSWLTFPCASRVLDWASCTKASVARFTAFPAFYTSIHCLVGLREQVKPWSQRPTRPDSTQVDKKSPVFCQSWSPEHAQDFTTDSKLLSSRVLKSDHIAQPNSTQLNWPTEWQQRPTPVKSSQVMWSNSRNNQQKIHKNTDS